MLRIFGVVGFCSLLILVNAAIGPSGNLVISSKDISPDGFSRA
jgi:hypothetical protein